MSHALRSTIRSTGGIFVVAALALAACQTDQRGEMGEQPGADTVGMATAPTTTPGMDTAVAAVTDPEIAAIVVAANTADIRAGELARDRAMNAEVRSFAERMITDHTAVNEQASDLVSRLGVTPQENATSQQLTQGGEQTRERLSGLSGAAFDSAYIAHEVMYHQQVLDALDNTLIPSAQNAELRALLEQSRPAFVSHLEMAREVQSSLGGGA